MASTFEQIFQRLQEQRDATPEKSPVADSLNRLADAMSVMRNGIASLDDTIKERRATQGAERNLAQAEDVKQQIRTLLELKVAEDRIESDRHQRMMDMAESLVPQVTDEQLETIREQRKAYREQQWALKEELRIAEETAKVQKENSQAIADAEKSAIADKYGTISGAVSGIESKAQDPLSKMLVQKLGSLVKGKEEARTQAVVRAQADRDRLTERDITWTKEDIQEDAALEAYRKGIKDPGSAIALLKQREQQISALARQGESLEARLVSGNFKREKGKQRSREARAAEIMKDASPAVLQAVSGEYTPVAQVVEPTQPAVQETVPVAQTQTAPQPAPDNARFRKAETQSTEPVTPVNPDVKKTNGAFGGKGGFIDLGGIGKMIGNIVGPIKSMAGSFLKFLGPWSLVANAMMSFDRLVPLVSDGVGAIMDMAKLLMPMTVTALMEGFAGLLSMINSLINVMPGTTNLDKKTAARRAELLTGYQAEADAQFEAERRQKKAITDYDTSIVDTTSARRTVIGRATVSRREAAFTTPSEAASITEQARVAQAPAPAAYQVADWQEQREQNQVMRESVMAAATNPGTTPIMVMNPALAPWNV